MAIRTPKSRLAVVLISAASCLVLAGAAQAQDAIVTAPAAPAPAPEAPGGAPPAADGGDAAVSEVVVTGFRSSLQKALDIKRTSAGVVDSIVAEDIAKFPDNNIAESIQRIPGVSISRDGGEGRQLSVRGLGADFTRVRLNGMEALATSSGLSSSGGTNKGRGFDFNIFASELFNNIQVRKTPSAEVDEGSLGATVDLRASRPFDFTGFKIAGSAQGRWSQVADKANPRGAFLITNTWRDGTLGALFSVAYSEREAVMEGSNSGQWDFGSDNGGFGASTAAGIPLSQLNSSTLYHPRFPRYGQYNIDEKRLGLTGSLQYAPTADTTLSFDMLYSKLDTQRREHYLEAISLSRAGSQGGKPEMTLRDGEVRDNLLVYGAFDGVDLRAEEYLSDYNTEFTQYNLELKHNFSDKLSMRAYGGVSRSDFDNRRETTVQMDRLNSNGYSFDYREDPKHPTLNYGFDVADPANWYIGPLVRPAVGATIPGSASLAGGNQGPEIRLRPTFVDNSFKVGQVDFTYAANAALTLKAGVQAKEFGFNSRSLRMVAERNIPAIPAGYSVADLTSTIDVLKHFDTPAGTPTTWLVPDINKFAQIYGIYNNSGFFALQGDENASARGEIRSVTEKDTAAYLQADFNTAVGPVPLRGDIGLRYVKTKQSSTGYANLGASFSQTTVDRTYDNFLPALNLATDLSEDVVLRFSASKVMTRPGLGSLTPGGSVNVAGGSRSVTTGNPELKPIKATTYDLSAEWYFAPQSLLSVGLFYKDIGTYIQTLNEIRPFNTSGLPDSVLAGTGAVGTDNFTFTTPVNTKGGPLQGIEISYQQPFKFLPGKLENLGVILNYTRVKSEIDYLLNATSGVSTTADLIGLSKSAYNATLYYEDDKVSARISAAFRDNYLRAVPGPYNTDVSGTQGTLNVDASFSYKISDQFTVTAEALNLTDEYDDLYVRSDELTEDYRHAGRQFSAGFRFSF